MKKIHWDLEDILHLEDYHMLLKAAEKDIAEFNITQKTLNANISIKEFTAIINNYEQLVEKLMRLYARALLWEEIEQQNAEPKFLKSKANNLLILFDEQTRALWHWLKGKEVEGLDILDEKNAERLFQAIPNLTYIFERERQLAKHTLDNDVESIITNKDVYGISSLLDIRAQLDTNIKFQITINGKRKIIRSISELMQLVQSKNAKVRETAYRALYKHYQKHEHKYFTIYEAIVKNWNYEVKLRGYCSAINMRNVKNDVPDEIISTLLNVCKNNSIIFQHFFKLKAKLLNKKVLSRFDLYAPVKIDIAEKKYSYEDSLTIVRSVLEAFDSDFLKHMNSIVDTNHIDAFPDQHKVGGAFCMTVSNQLKPYVMLNFLGSNRDVMTMAHELGHAIHSIFSSKQSVLAQDAPLTIAETASTFAEALVFEKLYQETNSKDEKINMLAHRLSDNYATVMRQNFFVMFELEAHKLIPQGVRITELHDLYLKNLQMQFGDAIDIDPVFKYEWLHIPHIVNSPFYCYAYSFGELLAMALFNNYKREGDGYKNKIKAILTAGGSENAVELLKQQGIDITQESFWQSSFDYIASEIDNLEKMLS